MSDFKRLSDMVWASPQISPEQVAEAHARGFTAIINNRPDGESDDQPAGAEIEAAAKANGMAYSAIPVTSAGFSEPQVKAMTKALAESSGPVLAYCRSGTRSTFLWSLVQASQGRDPEEVAEAAATAGYDITSIRPVLDLYAAKARN